MTAECCACGLVHECIPREDTTPYTDAQREADDAQESWSSRARAALRSARNVLLTHTADDCARDEAERLAVLLGGGL